MNSVPSHPGRFTHRTESTLVCRRQLWEFMVALGSAFGWRQLGTSYINTSEKAPLPFRTHDYIPGSSSDSKRISESDARGWADALQLALSSTHLDNMLSAHRDADPGSIQSPTADHAETRQDIRKFAQWLSQGPLVFAMNESNNSLVIRMARRSNVVELRTVK